MKEEYDFSKARKNPYANKLKKQISIGFSQNLRNLITLIFCYHELL